MDKEAEGTKTDVSGWARVVPGRGDVSRSTTIGASFGKTCRNEESGQVDMDQAIQDKNGGMVI